MMRGSEVSQSSFGAEVLREEGVMILRVEGEEMTRKRWKWVWPVCCRPGTTEGGRKPELNLEAAIKFMQRGFLFVIFLVRQ